MVTWGGNGGDSSAVASQLKSGVVSFANIATDDIFSSNNHAPTGEVIITGKAEIGKTLSVSNTLADADGMGKVHYQWLANGQEIKGATKDAYKVTEKVGGKALSVLATYTDGQGTGDSATSLATSFVGIIKHGGSVSEKIYGGSGNDSLYGESGHDYISANDGNDKLYGGLGNDSLLGRLGNDTLEGGNGNDRLSGNYGHDKLTGGDGYDSFHFDSKPNAQNDDIITDFNVTDDMIELREACFGSLKHGVVDPSQLIVGSAAADADDYLVYNKSTGELYYDADGSGSGEAELIVTLGINLKLTTDNLIITYS